MKDKKLFLLLALFIVSSSLYSQNNTFPISGNVGIGNANPTSKLQVDVPTTNSSLTTALRLSAVGTAWGNTGASIDFYNQDNGGVNLGARIASSLYDGGANAQKADLVFYTTFGGINTEKMRIANNGFVGIGTGTPTTKLDVVGSIKVSGDASNVAYWLPNNMAIRTGVANTNAYFDVGNMYIRGGDANLNAILRVAGSQAVGGTYNSQTPPTNGLIVEGNVGIGTTTPILKLDILGRQRIVTNDISNTPLILENNQTEITNILYRTKTGGNDWYVGNENGHFTWYNGDYRIRILNNGNVGIGTTAAISKLDIAAGSNQYENPLTIRNVTHTTSRRTGITLGTTGASFQMGVDANANGGNDFYLYDAINNQHRLNISNSGNIGIGITNPTAKLEVAGGGIIVNNAGTSSYGSGMKFRNDGYNQFSIGVKGTSFVISQTNSDGTAIWPTTLNDRFLISQSGNIGINTTTPNNKLEIKSDSVGKSGLRFTNLTSGTLNLSKAIGVNVNGDVVLLDGNATGTVQQVDINGYKSYYTNQMNAEATQAKRYEIARIFTDLANWSFMSPIEVELDEVYYGTGAKRKYSVYFGYLNNYKLVQTEVNSPNGGGHNNFQLTIGDPVVISGNNKYLPIYVDVRYYAFVRALIKTSRAISSSSTSGTSGSIYINTNPTAMPLADFTSNNSVNFSSGATTTILNGNVGIGTNNPQAKLEVTGGSVRFTENWFPYSDGNNYYRANTHIFADASGNEKIRMMGNGNVGIGTTSPGYKLHVEGKTRMQDAIYVNNGALVGYVGSRSTWTGSSTTNNDLVIGSYQPNVAFFTNNSTAERMRIDQDGQVVIGNPTAIVPTDYKLAVAGNLIAEKVKVKKQASGWPDFVFSPTYKLPTLTEVENFVKQNQHLPEIPSATEIEKEGQDLGEMNRLLLKKVEELTLYIISQEKKSNIQDAKIKHLELQIDELKSIIKK